MSEEERRLDELLGAYALDAVSDEERREVEQYLLLDPRARKEVEDHREVATMLAWSGVSAPDGLWERIAEKLDDTAPPPSGELAAVLSFDAAAARHDGEQPEARRSARRRRSFATGVGAWIGATAAAALIAVIAVSVVQSRDDGGGDIEAMAEAALNDRDSAVAKLVSADGALGGEAVIDQDGHGYLIARALPPLTDDRTYQLWGVIDGEAISLGVLGAAPETEMFTADGEVTQLVITNEVAGGVITNGNPDGAYAGIIG
jgi:anti-sigma-K factor RskA